MYEFIIASAILIQSVIIIIGSVVVLQSVLHRCSAILRLAFVIFPIGASLEFMDILYLNEAHLSSVVINSAIILSIIWMWTQRVLIADLERMIYKDDATKDKYSFIGELKVILSSFAVWIIRKLNVEESARCSVCDKILL